MAADLVIKGGTVIDGTGAPGRRAEVAIAGDRIVEIGHDLDGARVIDAGGMVVAPGFIDIHTHYDAQVFWDPALTPSCFHGVTTVFAGNCGFSIAPVQRGLEELVARTLENVEDMSFAALMAGVPWDFETFPEYLDAVRRRDPMLNFGAYVGHSAVRMAVLGTEAYERAATDDELSAMRGLVRDAMDAGAVGFSSSYVPVHLGAGGKPVPSRLADAAEFEALTGVLAELGRGVIGISGTAYPEGMYEFQRRNGRPLTYPLLSSRRTAEELATHRTERAAGSEVWLQVTPRPLVMGMTGAQPYMLNSVAPIGELLSASREERAHAYADPAWRAAANAAIPAAALRPNWGRYMITESDSHPELVGRPLAELAEERGCLPLDLLLDVAIDDGLDTRFQTVVANGDPEVVHTLLTGEGVTLGLSDAGAHVSQLCDAAQATDLLARWVREREAMTLEHAVRMLSGLQADIYALADRGYLRPGAFADVAIFDPATVDTGPVRRVADLPGGGDRLTADAPTGIAHVIVNGTPVVADGALLGNHPGTVLDRQSFTN